MFECHTLNTVRDFFFFPPSLPFQLFDTCFIRCVCVKGVGGSVFFSIQFTFPPPFFFTWHRSWWCKHYKNCCLCHILAYRPIHYVWFAKHKRNSRYSAKIKKSSYFNLLRVLIVLVSDWPHGQTICAIYNYPSALTVAQPLGLRQR